MQLFKTRDGLVDYEALEMEQVSEGEGVYASDDTSNNVVAQHQD